jgi:hypothetical protein
MADRGPLFAEVAPQSVEIRAQLANRPLDSTIVQVHVPHRRHVNFGALDLADGCPEDLALLASGSSFRELDDGVTHASTLGRRA